jgi:hypothetical protein
MKSAATASTSTPCSKSLLHLTSPPPRAKARATPAARRGSASTAASAGTWVALHLSSLSFRYAFPPSLLQAALVWPVNVRGIGQDLRSF